MHAPYNNAENTAKADLLSKGFLATEYNYEEGANIYAAHTIGYRNIAVNAAQETGGTNNDNSNNVDAPIGSIGDNSGNFPTVETYGGFDYLQADGNSRENVLTPTDNIIARPLVVVAIRGSVTFADWVIDLGNQFNDEHQNFQTGMKEVIKSLYGCTELCDECTDILHNCGFVDDNPEDDVEENIREVNYTPVTGIAAHTIGHREITIIDNSTTGDDSNDNDSNDASDDGIDSGSNANLSTIGVADTITGSTDSEPNEIRGQAVS